MRLLTIIVSSMIIISAVAQAEMSQECLLQGNSEFAELKLASVNLNKEIERLINASVASSDWNEKQVWKNQADKLLLEDRQLLVA